MTLTTDISAVVEPPHDHKQLQFCETYLSSIHRDPVKCVMEVWPELTIEQARGKSGALMRTSHNCGAYIHYVIQKMHRDLLPSMMVTEGSVMAQIGRLAFSNIKNLYDNSGELLHPSEMHYDAAAAVTEVTERVLSNKNGEEVLERKYKLADKSRALEMLGRHLQLFVDKNESTVNLVGGEMLELIASANKDDSPIPK